MIFSGPGASSRKSIAIHEAAIRPKERGNRLNVFSVLAERVAADSRTAPIGGRRFYPSKSCFVGPCFFVVFARGTFTAAFFVAAFFRALVFSEDS